MALAGLILAGPLCVFAQQTSALPLPASEASETALPLPEDRGQAALEQALRKLGTTASLMMIVAHPDDEDGALLTYLSRELGVRCTLLTLTRGEGGQNAMGGESYDALGLIRTNELLKASEYYGAKQLFGTEADFGFSKTQEESFARWGHERVLYDAVLAVRRERPQVIVSTFVGGVTDGHGHHQVSGEIAQEAFKAAADPKVFPEQLKDGLQPWQPLAVYSMVPFAPISEKGMFDYATGKWAPAKFRNYDTGAWSEGALSTDVTLQVGERDPVLGRSPVQIAREGWGQQKSQYGGANPALSGPATTSYHLWAVDGRSDVLSHPSRKDSNTGSSTPLRSTPNDGAPSVVDGLFHNSKVQIDTGIEGLAGLVNGTAPAWLTEGLHPIGVELTTFEADQKGLSGVAAAHKLAPICKKLTELYRQVGQSDLEVASKQSLLFELGIKVEQSQAALKELLGLDVTAFTAKAVGGQGGGPGGRGGSADEMPRSVAPGESFLVRVHATQATTETQLTKIWLDGRDVDPWKYVPVGEKTQTIIADPRAAVSDPIFSVQVAANAEPTAPYFTRPSLEQPYYDLSHPEDRLRPFAPFPLEAWAEFTFEGLPIRIGQVVQTLERVPGLGGVYEPLVVTPAIGVRMEPEARILPLDGSALPVKVTIHAQAKAEGTVELKLPTGWIAEPNQQKFALKTAGDSEPLLFSVTPAKVEAGRHTIEALAHSAGHDYQTGWQSVGYVGLRPYNLYRPAELKTRKVDVKLAPGLRVGYIMGTGDEVPEAIEGLGVMPHLLTATELAKTDFSSWNVVVIGIRAYSARPELASAQPRLEAFVRNGGTLVVQYQSASFPAPLPLAMGRTPERVVDEQAPVKLLAPANPLLGWPNALNPADFDGWVEERGHGFLDSWDPGYTALTETGDAGQDPQQGGLLVAHVGKGIYIYDAFALHRQLPELVPGAYRLLANLLSAGKEPDALRKK